MVKWTAADVEGLRAHIQEQGAALNHADAQGLCAYIAELEATIARVRELPAEWKLAASPENREGLEMAADDLTAALTPTTEGS